MIGAALAAPAMAAMDSSGITPGFFYDTKTYNPIVKVVVGEKGAATDAVAAGNIAATIGNLAYVTKTVTPAGASYVPEGRVVITTAARGATGDYVQDVDIEEATEDFYDEDAGLHFEGQKTYEKGDFTTYTLSCDKQTRTEAGLLKDGSFNNIHCLFCHNLCLESLENPTHDMKESITVDSDLINYYESGMNEDDSEALKMAIEKDAISYKVETGYIPMKRISRDPVTSNCEGEDCYIDFEYRGQMILFGEPYYVKDVDGDKIYLAKGKVLTDVTSEGWTAEYNGYKFKVDHLIYAAEYTVAGILLDVQKPDQSVVQVQISKLANGVVDNLEISGVTAEEAAALQSAEIIVYDLASQVVLEDGEDLEIGGEIKKDWEVQFEVVDTCAEDADARDVDCDDVDGYDEMDEDAKSALLKSITVRYRNDLDGDEALETDESLSFPNNFKLTFKGYLTNDFEDAPCSGADEGNILVDRVGDTSHELQVSFTGDDDNRYNEVKLSEGPFSKNDLFILDGVVYKYDSWESNEGDATDAGDTMDVTIDPQIRGNKVKVDEMQRYCDPEDDGATGNDLTFTDSDCTDLANDGKILLRYLALTDALTDDAAAPITKADYENDDEVEVEGSDLFIDVGTLKDSTGADLVLFFDDSDNSILFATAATDFNVGVNGAMIGTFDDFEVDGYSLDMDVTTEAGLFADPNSDAYVAASDINADGDDDDVLVTFQTDDGPVIIDMSDRDYTDDTDYENSVGLYTTTNTEVMLMDEDIDTMLMTPEGGDKFTVDWGSDSKVDGVEVCHPIEKVDSTYFLGTVEETTTSESILTEKDVGSTVSAGCCEFTVKAFEVNVGNATAAPTTTASVTMVPSQMVVPESQVASGETANLIIVGGPKVNGLAEGLELAGDNWIVKKDRNMVFVAGMNSDDTVSAGSELIKWLKANVHA